MLKYLTIFGNNLGLATSWVDLLFFLTKILCDTVPRFIAKIDFPLQFGSFADVII